MVICAKFSPIQWPPEFLLENKEEKQYLFKFITFFVYHLRFFKYFENVFKGKGFSLWFQLLWNCCRGYHVFVVGFVGWFFAFVAGFVGWYFCCWFCFMFSFCFVFCFGGGFVFDESTMLSMSRCVWIPKVPRRQWDFVWLCQRAAQLWCICFVSFCFTSFNIL